MKNNYFRSVVMLIVVVGISAAVPVMHADGPFVRNPCVVTAQDEHDRAVKAENELSAARLELKTCMARQAEELVKANRTTVDAERDLASERKESQQKAAAMERAGSEKDEKIVMVTAERDAAMTRIDHTDHSNFCKVFGICTKK